MSRVGWAESTDGELPTEHTEVFSDWEHFAFGMEVGNVGFEEGTGGYS